MSFRDEIIHHYLDRDELVTLDRDPSGPWSCGNSLLYSGLFVILLALNGELQPEDAQRFRRSVVGCQVPGHAGLYNRNPGRPDWESHDDYVGVAAGDAFSLQGTSKEIVEFGQNNSWCFDNQYPGEKSFQAWHGRFPGRIAFYRLAAGDDVGLVGRVVINIGLRGAMDEFGAGERLLGWMQVQVLRLRSCLPELVDLYEQSVEKDFGSVAGMMDRAIGRNDHPFAQWKLS
jgi:hypothetical protein